jgi:hypothetical protein
MENSSHSLRAPEKLQKDIVDINVKFYDFDDVSRSGTIQVHETLEEDVNALFEYMYKIKFPLSSVEPLSKFDYSDDDSMEANNTSSFNFRTVSLDSFRISLHGYGLAIDINPLLNPYINKSIVLPPEAVYDITKPGTLYRTHPIVQFMQARGFIWGGDWEKSYDDYHHFHKGLSPDMLEKYVDDISQALGGDPN